MHTRISTCGYVQTVFTFDGAKLLLFADMCKKKHLKKAKYN